MAETAYTPFRNEPDAVPVRRIVRRVKPTPGSQLARFANYSYHACITYRDGDTRMDVPAFSYEQISGGCFYPTETLLR